MLWLHRTRYSSNLNASPNFTAQGTGSTGDEGRPQVARWPWPSRRVLQQISPSLTACGATPSRCSLLGGTASPQCDQQRRRWAGVCASWVRWFPLPFPPSLISPSNWSQQRPASHKHCPQQKKGPQMSSQPWLPSITQKLLIQRDYVGHAPQMRRAPLLSEVQPGLPSICPASVSDRTHRREPAPLSPWEPNAVFTHLRRTHLIRSTSRRVNTIAYWSRHTPSGIIPHPWKTYLRTSIYPSIPQLWPK